MSKAKKIISGLIKGGFEFTKDSAKQIADTVAPGKLLEQAVSGVPQRKDEFSEYLKNLGPNLSEEEIAKKRKEFEERDQKELEEERKKLWATVPPHMRLPEKPKSLSPYEQAIQEEEKKKAMAVEAQKKQQQQQPLAAPAGKQPRGMLFAKKRPATKGFEGLQKDTKVG